MSADNEETIIVKFVMNKKNGKIEKIKDKDNNDAPDEDPSFPTTWASAIVASKNSPGKIYIWTGTKWKCIKT